MATGPSKGLDKMTKNTKIVAIFAVFFNAVGRDDSRQYRVGRTALANTAFS